MKYTWFDPAPDSAHNMVLSLVPPHARVLEFGCATGYMSAELGSRLGCVVTGIELSAEAAEEARPRCARVIVGDVERLDLALLSAQFNMLMASPEEYEGRIRATSCKYRALLAQQDDILAQQYF